MPKKNRKVDVAVEVRPSPKKPFPKTLVVAHPSHVFDVPEVKPIMGNITDFMRDIGGGAVLVRFKWRPSSPWRILFTIERIDNGPEITRMTGIKVEDYEPHGGMTLEQVGGSFKRPE